MRAPVWRIYTIFVWMSLTGAIKNSYIFRGESSRTSIQHITDEKYFSLYIRRWYKFFFYIFITCRVHIPTITKIKKENWFFCFWWKSIWAIFVFFFCYPQLFLIRSIFMYITKDQMFSFFLSQPWNYCDKLWFWILLYRKWIASLATFS